MPNTSFEFPYHYAQIEDWGRLFYPIVEIELCTIAGWRPFEFLVDTGADVTTVPSHLLPVLGLEKTQLVTNNTVGVGGVTLKSWDFKLPIKLGRQRLTILASAVNTRSDTMPLLLGRKDIFEKRYNLLLDSRRQSTIITAN